VKMLLGMGQFVDQLFIMALWAVDLEMVPAGDMISYAMEDETYRHELEESLF